MTVLFFPPDLTLASHSDQALAFYTACVDAIRSYTIQVATPKQCDLQAIPDSVGAALFFNRPDQCYSPEFLSCLQAAKRNGAQLFPIGLTDAHMDPPPEADPYQSWPVAKTLEAAGLQPTQTATVAAQLGRKVVATLRPTLATPVLTLFVSYKRKDGAEAELLAKRLQARRHRCYLDTQDLMGGDLWREAIAKWLGQSDAVIFVETPMARSSKEVERELKTALAENIPIVWVRIGQAGSEAEPAWLPGATRPHIEVTPDPVTGEIWSGQVLDRIVETAYAVAAPADRVLTDIKRIQSMAETYGIETKAVTPSEMLYTVQIPHPDGFRYHRRPMTHLVQFYGRPPKDIDISKLSALAHKVDPTGQAFDARLALGPLPAPSVSALTSQSAGIDSSTEYVHTVLEYLNQPRTRWKRPRGVILSGSFPDNDPVYQRRLTNAVQAMARAIMEQAGILIFGGHPTFQPLIRERAKRSRPADYKAAVHLYLSRRYVQTQAEWDEYQQWATVTPVDAVGQVESRSLTAMRTAMIADPAAMALIALGGKTANPGKVPGVDEEVELARARGLPVFLIGAPGGRAAELASRCTGLNRLSPEANQELLVRLEFGYLADMILHHLEQQGS